MMDWIQPHRLTRQDTHCQIAVKQVVCFCFSKRQAFTHPLPLCILSAIDTVIYWRFFYRIDFFQQVGIFNPILRRIGRGVVGDNQRGYITGYNHVDLFHVCYIRIIRNLEIRCRKSHARLCLNEPLVIMVPLLSRIKNVTL